MESALVSSSAANPLDVLVIGGGATGCGGALDAARRGLRVGLVERDDFSSGTSSRSTKLIHGGKMAAEAKTDGSGSITTTARGSVVQEESEPEPDDVTRSQAIIPRFLGSVENVLKHTLTVEDFQP
ncbi:hypothetical protein CASFOL_038361 [Castilleja foliolosa]|uniref:Glycerol-3-phosphate dehydrogenase n=1 Tax=Castilleja foliolosa TaxID=1961234 RepID=A0ABD3BMU8_9LAMI